MNRDQNNNERKIAGTGSRPLQQPRARRPVSQTAARVDTSGPAEKASGRVTTTGPAVPARQYHYSTSTHLERVQAKKRQNIAREAEESARKRAISR